MSWFDGARARLALLFAREAAEARINDEIAFHIAMESDRLVSEMGLSPDEARRRALATFGGVTQHKEQLRRGRGLTWLSGLSIDGRLALRMMAKTPGLTLVAVVGMAVAVAIGAVSFSAIYTIIDGRLPISGGDRVVGIRNIDGRRGDARATHLHDLTIWREALTTVPEIGAYRIVARNAITPDGRAESARIAEMTASGFRLARVAPLVGRYFHDDDERTGAPPVAVIGFDVWQERFGARADIVGSTIQLGDERHTVIGVMPKGFAFPVNNHLWTPLRLNAADYERGSAPEIDVFGRLASGKNLADAQRQAATIGQRLAAAYPETHSHIRPRIVSYTKSFLDDPALAWAFHLAQLLVSMLLVVIGTNVAILVYARTAGRMGEIAIRTALGATRARVVAQLFAEALALSMLAGGVGIVGAHLALLNIDAVLARMGGEQLPFWMRFRITPGVVVYCAGLAVVGAVIVGVVPALKATSGHVRANLQHLSAGRSGMRLGRTWTLLIIAQVAVAVAVLPVAIAGVAAWKRIESAESALAAKQILTAALVLDEPGMPGQRIGGKRSVLGKVSNLGAPKTAAAPNDEQRASRFLGLRAELVERLRAEPGVTDVIFASNAPGGEATTRVAADTTSANVAATGAEAKPDPSGAVVGATRVDLRYFDALGIPILAGRAFQAGDVSTSPSVVIVNRSFVRRVFEGGNPLGRRIRMLPLNRGPKADAVPQAPWEEIVGVVPDFPVDSTTPTPKIYRPMYAANGGPVTIAVRLQGITPTAFANRLRELTVATNPMLRLEIIRSLEQTLEDDSAGRRLTILALELVTLSTVLLSAAGIYALLSFTITRRRREIGIRAALGAGPRRLLVSVLSRVTAQIVTGIVLGIAVAALLDHTLNGGWTGRRATLVLPGVVGLMTAIGLLAAVRPARQALRIQPTEALRAE